MRDYPAREIEGVGWFSPGAWTLRDAVEGTVGGLAILAFIYILILFAASSI